MAKLNWNWLCLHSSTGFERCHAIKTHEDCMIQVQENYFSFKWVKIWVTSIKILDFDEFFMVLLDWHRLSLGTLHLQFWIFLTDSQKFWRISTFWIWMTSFVSDSLCYYKPQDLESHLKLKFLIKMNPILTLCRKIIEDCPYAAS